MFPLLLGFTAVTFTTTDFAVEGMPHRFERMKVRAAPATSAGPPRGPLASRVSTARQGTTEWKLETGGATPNEAVKLVPEAGVTLAWLAAPASDHEVKL